MVVSVAAVVVAAAVAAAAAVPVEVEIDPVLVAVVALADTFVAFVKVVDMARSHKHRPMLVDSLGNMDYHNS